LNISRVLHDYDTGDRVAIVLDGGQQGGMPHRRFNGRTGFIQKKQGVAWIVAVKDGNMQKTVIARPEHLRPLE
jgi:large subunit ribosomal protein L21e